MSESGRAKTRTCRLCGEDCSRRKRVKDAEGHYYCLSCFENRLEHVRRKRERHGNDDTDAGGLTGTMSGTFGVDQELVASEVAKVEKPDDGASVLCPACGLAVKSDAVLCVHCGHDFEAGKQRKVRRKVVSRERPAIWPVVIGFLCVLFGVSGLVIYGGQLTKAILLAFSESSASIWLMSIVITSLIVMVVLTALHGVAGAIVWMRFEAGVMLLRYWIRAKLILFTLVVAVGLLSVHAFPGYVSEFEVVHEAEARFGAALPDTLDRTLVGLWVWQCSWPLLLLLFLRSEQVQKDIRAWDAPLEPSTALYRENVAN